MHNLIGAGAAEGAVDAANILKPTLARGEIQIIGATTLEEYRRHIEKDAALERRFQPVTVAEPSQEEAVEILKGLRDKYEAHHRVRITDEAIQAAVKFSSRYIADRFLPDKAIDLIDEAASHVRMHAYKAPPDLKELEDRLETLQAEKEAAVNAQEFERAASLRDEEKQLRLDLTRDKSAWQERSSHTAGEVTVAEIARSYLYGRESPPRSSPRKRVSACCIWRKSFIGGLLGRKKPCMRYLVLCAALASAYGIRSARSAPFYSSALLALAKQSSAKRLHNRCSAMKMR